MKNEILNDAVKPREEVIAMFGEAQLIRVDGDLELRGGSMADRTEALEWVMIMMPAEAPRLRR